MYIFRFLLVLVNLIASCRCFHYNSGAKKSGHSVFVTMALNPPLLIQGARVVASIPVMYSLMSFNEYMTHRYYQHNELIKIPFVKKSKLIDGLVRKLVGGGGGHVEHHAETLDDMTLKTDERWKLTSASIKLDADKYRGTAFTWQVTCLMFLQLLATCVPTLKLLLNFNPITSLLMIIPSLAVHSLIWNALHPAMHGLEDIELSEGPPARFFAKFRSSMFFKWLYQNHEGHHVLGGLKNYNVCCPGFDHLLGTYVEEKNWRPKVKVPISSQLSTSTMAITTSS